MISDQIGLGQSKFWKLLLLDLPVHFLDGLFDLYG